MILTIIFIGVKASQFINGIKKLELKALFYICIYNLIYNINNDIRMRAFNLI